MTNDCMTCSEYLVRRHVMTVARYFMPDSSRALIATHDAGLGGSIQALLRVVFGYRPDVRVVSTMGQLLDGLADRSFDLAIMDDHIFTGRGIGNPPLDWTVGLESRAIIISRSHRSAAFSGYKGLSVVDVIHPDRLDSVRLSEAYIRACTFAALDARGGEVERKGAEGNASRLKEGGIAMRHGSAPGPSRRTGERKKAMEKMTD